MRTNILVAVTFYIGLTAIAIETAEAKHSRVTYGESCNITQKCLKRDWLACNNNGTCGCIKPDSMVFELTPGGDSNSSSLTEKGKCATKIGERCRFSLGEGENGKGIFDTFPCVRNGKCDEDGFCTCNQGFYEDAVGSCAKFQEHLQICDKKTKCSTEDGFECTDGLCRCKSTNSVYDSRIKRCVGLAGGSCLKNLCVENAVCNQGRCECVDGFFPGVRQSCSPQVGFNEKCSEDIHCGRDKYSGLKLKCIEGKCDCDPEKSVYAVPQSLNANQHYSYGRKLSGMMTRRMLTHKMCAPKANQPCANGLCAPNAYCNNLAGSSTAEYYASFTYPSSTSTSSYVLLSTTLKPPSESVSNVCVCSLGTTFSRRTGLCVKPYGSPCQGHGECADEFACTGTGMCLCKYTEQVYQPEKNICESKTNGPCSSNKECGTHAECRLSLNNSHGHCICKKGYTSDHFYGCKIAFNESCSYAPGECDTAAGLQCIDSRCKCPGFSKYSVERRKCMGLVGATCNGNGNECTMHASCNYVHSSNKFKTDPWNGKPIPISIYGYCGCNKGFLETNDYTCAPFIQEETLAFGAALTR